MPKKNQRGNREPRKLKKQKDTSEVEKFGVGNAAQAAAGPAKTRLTLSFRS